MFCPDRAVIPLGVQPFSGKEISVLASMRPLCALMGFSRREVDFIVSLPIVL